MKRLALTFEQFYTTCWYTGPPAGVSAGERAYQLLGDVRPDLVDNLPSTHYPAGSAQSPESERFLEWCEDHWGDDP